MGEVRPYNKDMDLIERLHKKSLPPKDTTLVAAVSGGLDSVSLLHLLLPLAAERDWELVVAHFNHQLRRAADGDEKFVKRLASGLGLKFMRGSHDVAKLAETKKLTLEEAAREARYAWLRGVAQRYPKSVIVTAHTADDQLETVVMNWLRGASVRGLAGMQELERGVWRPLLEVSKAELLDFAKRYHLKYRQDSTNLDTKHTRNLIRHQVIPMLSKINPNLKAMATRGSHNFSRLEGFLENQIVRLRKQVARRSKAGEVAFDLEKFKQLDSFAQDELVLWAVDKLQGSRQGFKQAHLHEVGKVVKSKKPQSCKQLPGKLFLVKARDKITISRYRPKDL